MPLTRVVPDMIQQTTARLLGRTTAGTGRSEEISVGSGLSLSAGSLSAVAGSETVAGTLELATSAEVQTGTDTTRAMTPAGFRAANIVLDTAKASTSGTSVDFTGIPSWAKRVMIHFNGVSTNGTSNPLIQIGSGSIDATGYLSSAQTSTTSGLATTGFAIAASTAAASVFSGSAMLSLMGSNTWALFGVTGYSNAAGVSMFGGAKTLGGALDRLRITTISGTDAFDAGTINISWE